MKLKILAAAVAASFAFPMAAQAEFKISGDVGSVFSSKSEAIEIRGTNIDFNGSMEIDGLTYSGNVRLKGDNSGASLDDMRVGVKGGFGEILMGDTDNACDVFDPGDSSVFIGGQTGSCGGSDTHNITYKNAMGPVSFAVSHNPGADQSALGAKFGMGGVSVNLGYEDGVGSGGDLISYGAAATFAGVSFNIEGNDDDKWGLNAAYSSGPMTVWASYLGDDGNGGDGLGAGFKYVHGNMDYIIEHNDAGDETIAGLRYRF